MAQPEDILYDIHVEMTRRGLPDLTDDILRELAKHVQHPDVLQGLQSGQWNAAKIVDEVQAYLQATVEGGDITPSDRGGQAVRQQYGIVPQLPSTQQGLPPTGHSRIEGSPGQMRRVLRRRGQTVRFEQP